MGESRNDVNKLFSTFYNKYNKIVNKHVPIKKMSNRKAKQLCKPWITKGTKVSISIKNKLYAIGDNERYRRYRNKICSLIRLSKKTYYQEYFTHNITNMKKAWEGINEILYRRRKISKTISSLKDPNNNGKVINEASQIPHIINQHFATVGSKLASKLPSSHHHYLDYVSKSPASFIINLSYLRISI